MNDRQFNRQLVLFLYRLDEFIRKVFRRPKTKEEITMFIAGLLAPLVVIAVLITLFATGILPLP